MKVLSRRQTPLCRSLALYERIGTARRDNRGMALLVVSGKLLLVVGLVEFIFDIDIAILHFFSNIVNTNYMSIK